MAIGSAGFLLPVGWVDTSAAITDPAASLERGVRPVTSRIPSANFSGCGLQWMVDTCMRLFDPAQRYRNLSRQAVVLPREHEHRDLVHAVLQRNPSHSSLLLYSRRFETHRCSTFRSMSTGISVIPASILASSKSTAASHSCRTRRPSSVSDR